ncbi:MAG: MOSC N-terminal beta barrel domain-containing protein, partial [Pseudonocardia sp.]|nr:MOSC N-terminal beta barrel domain-containing protein [Pseudonocardia sp.]
MKVLALRRYPVKSMLGEALAELTLGPGGVDGDRALALLAVDTRRVATAQHPRLWRALLPCSAAR